MPRPCERLSAVLAALALVLAACGGASGPKATASTDGLVSIGSGLRGLTGLAATVYATGVPKVSGLAFDDAGNLWAASADFNDTGADGLYVVTAAGAAPKEVVTGVHTPLGLVWSGGELYVASKERVDAYSRFDGTSFASHRTVLELPAGVGEVNGITVDTAGRVHLGISAPCDSCTPTLEQSGAVLSFAKDGTDVRVDVHHVRAPIGLTFFPGTDDLFVTFNQRDDLGDATPGDWLVVVKDGQDWAYPGCYGQGGDACAAATASGAEPVAELDRHSAVDGVAIITGSLGPTVGTSALVAEWAAGKVQRVALTRAADGTYTSKVAPFLTGLGNPVPALQAPDGSVLIGDWKTGTIYRIATAG